MASKNKKLAFAADIFEQDIEGIIRKIPIGDISPSAEQPRTSFDDQAIKNLAESIRTEGLMQPIVVTKEGTKYKIVAGERRFRAALIVGFEEIECRILRKNPKDTYRLAVIENLQRENLDPIDEARAFRKLKEEYQYSDGELARIVGKSRNYINEIVSVAEIPNTWISRAKDAGIESKNLFIQFAQAVKSGTGDQFIEAYRGGAMKTVAAAKQFNQEKKSGSSQPNKVRKPAISELQIKTEQRDHAWKAQISFSVDTPSGTDKVKGLEKALSDAIKRYFS